MGPDPGSEKGQALVEWCIVSAALVLVISGGTALLRSEWDRFRCSWTTFQQTHDRLIGRNYLTQAIVTRFTETRDSIQGQGSCGEAQETILLRKLEPDANTSPL